MHSRAATLRLASCLFVAAAVLLLSGSTAAASCGDYVHVRGSSQATDHQHTPPADSPCAHGQCDRLPIAPPAPEPTAPTGGSASDAVLAAVFVPSASAAFGFAADPVGVSVGSAFVPFHPPRV